MLATSQLLTNEDNLQILAQIVFKKHDVICFMRPIKMWWAITMFQYLVCKVFKDNFLVKWFYTIALLVGVF